MVDDDYCNGSTPMNEELDEPLFPDNPIGDYESDAGDYYD